MSEIEDMAEKWVELNAHVNYEAATAAMHITALLAELERVENSREAECMECEKLTCIEIRQQAVREVVEIIDKYPAFLFGADAVGVKLNLSQSIKARFGLDG